MNVEPIVDLDDVTRVKIEVKEGVDVHVAVEVNVRVKVIVEEEVNVGVDRG